MNINTKIFNKTAATFCVLVSAATYVHSAVTITFAQSGADVTVTSSGTFDPAVCVSTSIAISTGNYVSACYGEISMSNGSAYKICSQVSLSSSSSGLAFGQDNTFTADAQSGINF